MPTIIDQLEATRGATLAYFELPAESLDQTYGAGKWSIRYILHHLADAETVLYERIRRTISRPGQQVAGFDQDAWARELSYATKPLALSRAIYTSCREGIIHLAQSHYEGSASKSYFHSDDGERTLQAGFDKVVWHNQRHLDQIKKALQQG